MYLYTRHWQFDDDIWGLQNTPHGNPWDVNKEGVSKWASRRHSRSVSGRSARARSADTSRSASRRGEPIVTSNPASQAGGSAPERRSQDMDQIAAEKPRNIGWSDRREKEKDEAV